MYENGQKLTLCLILFKAWNSLCWKCLYPADTVFKCFFIMFSLLFFNSTSEDYFLTCWSLTASCQYSLSRQSRAKWRRSLIPGQEGHRQDIKAVQHLWPLHDFLMFSVVFLFYNLAAGQFTVHCCWSLIKELRLWANWLLTPSTGHSLGSPVNILYMYCSCAKWRKPEQNSAVM